MKLLTILAIVAAALALGGCDPAPKTDEPTAVTNAGNSAKPPSTSEPATPATTK